MQQEEVQQASRKHQLVYGIVSVAVNRAGIIREKIIASRLRVRDRIAALRRRRTLLWGFGDLPPWVTD